jgi:hypothetical protein
MKTKNKLNETEVSMTQETLTAKTRNGQTLTFRYGQYKTVKKHNIGWCVELSYVDAKKHLNVPTALKGKEIAITIVEQEKVAALFQADWDRKQADTERLINSGKIVGFHYQIGCDCADELWFVYDNENDVDFINVTLRRRERDEELAAAVADKINGKIEMTIETGIYSYGGWDLAIEQLKPLLDAAIGELMQEKAETEKKVVAREEKKQAIIEKAKATGEKQEMSRYSDECSEKDYDCDQDIVVTYAMPDGTTETVRGHCH